MDRELQILALQGRVRFSGQCRFDERHIDRWTAIYQANNLHARGVPYELFLQHPHEFILVNIFDVTDRPDNAPEFAPLLPRQQAIANRILQDILIREEAERHIGRLERDCSDVRARNGSFVEPLHHHRFPRNKARRPAASC